MLKVTTIRDGWKYIESYRRGRETKPTMPDPNYITNHFMSLPNGKPESAEDTVIEPQPHEVPIAAACIDEADFSRILNGMRNGKAVGLKKLYGEALKYADSKTKPAIREMMQSHLNGNLIPDDWRDANIHLLYVKGPPDQVKNYRGISIVNAVYKLYALIVCFLLSTYVEINKLLPDTQNGFRGGRSTIDSIYIVNHCVHTTISKGKHLYAAFIDYKAALDLVNRSKLFNRLKKIGIALYLFNAINEIYRSTFSPERKASDGF